MIEAILIILMGFPVHHTDRDEPPAERERRMTHVAVAVDFAADKAMCVNQPPAVECLKRWHGPKAHLVAAVLTIGLFESHYARAVHAGDKLGDRGQSISLWQLKRNAYLGQLEWNSMAGTDFASTVVAAQWAARMFSSAHGICARRKTPGIQAAISLYATGRSCTAFKQGPVRHRKYRRVLRKLYEQRAR